MSVICPYCDKETGISLSWNSVENEVCYGDSFKCPHCSNEIETEWETGIYDAVIDDYTDGFGYAKRKDN